jgi:XTP/dITP diphosphohydrolase
MKLVFASANRHKVDEIRGMLPQGFALAGLTDIGCYDDIAETSDTFEGNAWLKADYVTDKFGFDCFADDSGLEVMALDGAPGVYSARFASDQKSDSDNIDKLLKMMEGAIDRRARFRTVIALNFRGEKHVFSGTVEGTITQERRGDNGFGYDPIFVPDGFGVTFAEMASCEKAGISHRGKAVRELILFLDAQNSSD